MVYLLAELDLSLLGGERRLVPEPAGSLRPHTTGIRRGVRRREYV